MVIYFPNARRSVVYAADIARRVAMELLVMLIDVYISTCLSRSTQ